MMNMAYENTFKIFDHLGHEKREADTVDPDKKRPLIAFAFHDAEDPTIPMFRNYAKLFADLDIFKLFGISLLDFMDLQKETIEDLLEVAQQLKKTENAETGKVIDELKRSTSSE